MRIKRPFKKRGGFGPGFYTVAALILVTPLVLAGFAGYYLFLKDAIKPSLTLEPKAEATSFKRPFTLHASDDQSGIRSLVVTVTQGQRRFTVLHKDYDPPRDQVTVHFTLAGAELRGGTFEMQAAAADGSYANLGAGNTSRITRMMRLDISLPVVKPLTPAHYVRQGGVGLVVYDINKDVAKSGVQVGDRFFPGFRQKDGPYACLFAFPDTMAAEAFKPRRFRDERVELTDEYLASRLPAFAGLFPEVRDPIERFRKIDTELRRQNDATLTDLAAHTASAPLWDGPFLYLPHSVVKGSFGADRTYVYNGQDVVHEHHAGIDLASVPNAPVPAANNGVVVLAGPLGVYGQSVVIDHGMGLQSLYGHLSSIAVRVGDKVKKGDTIGATGATGLALGNDVHFAMLLDGQPVIPIEWWDAHWLEDNVTQKFRRYVDAPAGQ